MSVDKKNRQRNNALELLRDGRPGEAFGLLSRYCRKNKKDDGGLFLLGIANGQLGRVKEAAYCFNKVLRLNPGHSEAVYNLGKAYMASNDCGRAIDCFDRAVVLAPGMYSAYLDMGNAYRILGCRLEAESAFRQALSGRPEYAEAYFSLSGVKTFSCVDEDVVAMTALLERPGGSWEDRAFLSFGLSKAYEDMGDYDRAFHFLAEGNKLKRDSYEYDVSVHERSFAEIEKIFSEEFFRRRLNYGVDNEMPIFVVGMPRSGTTLVEQILSCHPAVYGAGELGDLSRIIFSLNPKLSSDTFPGRVVSLGNDDFRAFARSFLKRLSECSAGEAYVVDKNPANFILIGMIKLLFPRAKVIHCRRDAVDTCLSIYRQNFSSARSYAYDLVELGKYYRLYQMLMLHWENVLPGFVFELRYEDLVSNQALITRELLEFCGLPWDEGCLRFYDSGRPVHTASVEQVRQPLYKTSVQKWRNYERHLQPLLDILEVN